MSATSRRELILVCLVVAFLAIGVRGLYVPSFADRHVAVSEEKYGFDVGDPGPWFSAWSLGDGQAYVLIAIDPTGRKLAEEIPEAGYRYARAGYGWLGWGFSAGQSDLVPYSLALVGALSVMGALWIAIRVRPRLGPRAWLIVLNPAVFIGFAGDTSEPLAVFVLALVLATGSVFAAAALGVVRPTYAVALWTLWKHLLSALAAAVALAVYSLVMFGLDAMQPSGGRIGLPFGAYFDHPSIWGFGLGVAAVVTIAAGVKARDWAWVVAGLFIICFGDDVLLQPINAWRAAGFLPVLWAFGLNYVIPDRSSAFRPTAPAT